MRTSLRFPNPAWVSGSEKATPLGESGGAGELVVIAALEVALRWKVVVDRGVDGCELLQCSHAPEPQHRPFSSSEWQVRILGPVVEPAPHLAVVAAAWLLERRPVGSQAIRDDGLGSAMPFHGFLEEFQRGLAISRVGQDAFKNLALMINSPPEVMGYPVDLYVDLVQVPSPLSSSTHPLDPLAPDLGGKHRAKPVPPIPHGLMADLDAAFMQKILDVSKRQREPDVEHHRQADDLGACLEVTKRAVSGHPRTLGDRPAHFKIVSSDSAHRTIPPSAR